MKELDFAFIGNRIKDIRIEQRLTQEYLAESVGVNVSHISNIEHNKVKVSLTLLVRICNALGVSLDYILENEYSFPGSILEPELLNAIRTMPKEKQAQLLRIAKVL